jgi:signal transduction histidine kinase
LEEAEQSRDELSEAYHKLAETTVYEERNRIAKDIHDNAGHSMTTVIMQTEAAKLLIDTNPEEAKNSIISANIQARNALEQMRESVHLLAGRKGERSLREELEEIIGQTMDGTNLKVRYDLDDVNLSEEKDRFLCNSLKESLANGIRHGKATAFYVEMKKAEDSVVVLISDNGSGFDGEIQAGFGLRMMREKTETFGGTLEITSESGEGCEVKITLPLKDSKPTAEESMGSKLPHIDMKDTEEKND